MSVIAASLHPSIEAVPAEEQQWRAIGFREPDLAIRDVGLAEDLGGYYYRELDGTSNAAFIDDLDEVEPRQLEREHALALRANFDPHWRDRPVSAAWLGKLWVAGFFREYEGDLLAGYREMPTERHPDRVLRVSVEDDGTFELEEDDPTYIEKGQQVVWHRYRLPKSVFFAEHELTFESGEREKHLVVGSKSSVPGHVNSKLGDIVSAATKE